MSGTRNLAIMFTDIQGFTARTSVATREGIHQLLDVHEKLLKPVFSAFRGNVVKTIGDAFLVWFESPTDAVVCGLTIQEVLRQYNERAGEGEKLHVRVAINAGDVELKTDSTTKQLDVYGEAVNLAARLESITEANEVWFTEAVYLTMNRAEAPSTEIGERTFKGIPNPVRVYKVVLEPGSDHARELASRVRFERDGKPSISRDLPLPVMRAMNMTGGRRSGRAGLFAGAGTLLLVAVAAAGWFLARPGIQHKTAMRSATELAKQHRDLEALEQLGVALDLRPEGRAATDLARAEARAVMDADRKAKRHEAETLEKLDAAIAKHPGLARVLKKERAIQSVRAVTEKVIPELDNTAIDSFAVVRDEMAKSADDPDIYLAAADVLERADYALQNSLWLHAKAFDRGRAPDPALFDGIVRDFLNANDDDLAGNVTAREFCDKAFPDRIRAWALDAIEHSSNPYAFNNALAWLRDKKDPLGDRTDFAAIRDVLHGHDVPGATKRLLAEPDPARRAHAKSVLAESVDHYSFRALNRPEIEALSKKL